MVAYGYGDELKVLLMLGMCSIMWTLSLTSLQFLMIETSSLSYNFFIQRVRRFIYSHLSKPGCLHPGPEIFGVSHRNPLIPSLYYWGSSNWLHLICFLCGRLKGNRRKWGEKAAETLLWLTADKVDYMTTLPILSLTACVLILIYHHLTYLSQAWRLAQITAQVAQESWDTSAGGAKGLKSSCNLWVG